MADQIPSSFIPKKTPSGIRRQSSVKRAPLVDRFIIFPAIILLVSFSLGGGVFLYRKFIENRVNDLSENLRRIEAQFEAPLINELTRISKEIEAAKLILASHVQNSRVFDFMEEYTHTEVHFTSFSFDGAEASMSGLSPDYTTLAEQMRLFEESGIIRSLRISNIGLRDEGNVSFDITIRFDASVFAYQP